VHIGLGPAARIDEVLIHWPEGQEERHEDLPADRVLEFER
jgi:hypothetical protein